MQVFFTEWQWVPHWISATITLPDVHSFVGDMVNMGQLKVLLVPAQNTQNKQGKSTGRYIKKIILIKFHLSLWFLLWDFPRITFIEASWL